MKKFSLFLIVTVCFVFLVVACSSNDKENKDVNSGKSNEVDALKYEPEDIDPETDVCEVCAMAVADDRHATQIILKNDRALKFDDLGCLYAWIEENGEEDIGAKFVRDYHTEEWILLEEATYVFGEQIETPMAYGIISFKDKSDAKEYMEEKSYGELLSSEELADHKWEMMDHDHDHHDHGDGNDSHHKHGFHTEGFDMQVTELDDVKVKEEKALEVATTLDDSPLESADVRYEIWLENDKDRTDWVDAEETSPGNYVANYTFNEAGTYHIQVHVEDEEELHEHLEVEISVEE